jgi:hypothetical protein
VPGQHHSGRPSALEEQPLLAPVAPLKISFDAKIGGADPETHLNTFALSNVKLAGNAKWKDFANRTPHFCLSSLDHHYKPSLRPGFVT